MQLEGVDSEIRKKQQELLEAANDQTKIGTAIAELRDERQAILSDEAARHEQQEYAEDLAEFLNRQTEAITE